METSEVYPSPDERFVLEIVPYPMLMSHVVNSPVLYALPGRNCIFDPGSLWDAWQIEWSAGSPVLTMQMRHYSNGNNLFSFSLDLENDAARLAHGERVIFSGTIPAVEKALKGVSRILLPR